MRHEILTWLPEKSGGGRKQRGAGAAVTENWKQALVDLFLTKLSAFAFSLCGW